MPDKEKVFDALRNCITEPKCKDCPWETCEEFHQTKTLPLDLCLDILKLLKEQETKEGHWIVLEYCVNEGIYCSKCMNKIFDRSTKPKKKLSNYCPNCGSKNTHFFNPSTEKIMYSD